MLVITPVNYNFNCPPKTAPLQNQFSYTYSNYTFS